MSKVSPKLEFIPLGTKALAEILKHECPPLPDLPEDTRRQLTYIDQYVRALGCSLLAIETHYIDRDYIEDHSVFYSKSLGNYPNFCRRVHFFTGASPQIQTSFRQHFDVGRLGDDAAYQESCRRFSREHYLGFSVIKPLDGCPVGRTVLRPPDTIPPDNSARVEFPCVRKYSAHLIGTELTVYGLAFQQQDSGVSACATTALWCALQKSRDFEDIGSSTPAQITRLASQFTLPFGRSMPSEGLSIDQMCQATHAVGLSPVLYRADSASIARGYLHSSILSAIPVVLVISDRKGEAYHAVTAVGASYSTADAPTLVRANILDKAGQLSTLYVHDDRIGPYVRANLTTAQKRLILTLTGIPDAPDEQWQVTHLLIPLHGKIRLAFSGLRDVAFVIAADVKGCFQSGIVPAGASSRRLSVDVTFETRIQRAHEYLHALMQSSADISYSRLKLLATRVPLPRYLGIVRIATNVTGELDVVFDTTSTTKNIRPLAVVAHTPTDATTARIAQLLASMYACNPV